MTMTKSAVHENISALMRGTPRQQRNRQRRMMENLLGMLLATFDGDAAAMWAAIEEYKAKRKDWPPVEEGGGQ